MNLPDLRNNNVRLFLNKEDIIHETAAQIMKDFGMFGIEITFSGDVGNAYYELHDQLVNHIAEYLNRDYGKLMSVFYQVDITEKEIQRTANEMPEYNEVEVLAHQVIYRDLKKVLFRRYYRSHPE